MRKIKLVALLVAILTIIAIPTAVTAVGCDYYVGDAEVTLPELTTEIESMNTPTFKRYVACLYKDTNGEFGVEMMQDNKCRAEPATFVPDTVGSFNYRVAILYMERQWSNELRMWSTTDFGVDGTLSETYEVCPIPDDTGEEEMLAWVETLKCELLDIDCPATVMGPESVTEAWELLGTEFEYRDVGAFITLEDNLLVYRFDIQTNKYVLKFEALGVGVGCNVVQDIIYRGFPYGFQDDAVAHCSENGALLTESFMYNTEGTFPSEDLMKAYVDVLVS